MQTREYMTNNLHSQRLEDVIHELEAENERLRDGLDKMRGWETWRAAGGGYAAAFRGVMADIEALLSRREGSGAA